MKFKAPFAKQFTEKLFICFLLSLCIFGIVSCEKDDIPGIIPDDEDVVDAVTQQVNNFVLSYNYTYYLWRDKINYNNKDPKYIEDPEKLFEDLIYKDLDIWSYLTNDAESMFSSYEGVETSYGYNLLLGKFANSSDCFAIVNYVYPESPAAKGGIKRGDIIIGMNGGSIPESKLGDLYYSSSIELQLGELIVENGSNVIAPIDQKVSLTAVKLKIDAVNAYTVIEEGNHKIGYICYTDYLESSHLKLSGICNEFKSKGVTDVVLDLRYNPGGAAKSATYLSSLFVPRRHVENQSLYLKELWNNTLTEYLQQEGENLYTTFDKNALAANMDLSRIFVLTTSGTASASEATIVGLMPYMDVIKIGTTTHGKYCAALLLQPQDNNGNIINSIKNWAMSLVVYKFANANDYTDFTGGIKPDYEVEDDPVNMYQFGDVNDPHLAKAIELITGKPAAGTRSISSKPDGSFQILENQSESLNRKGGFLIVQK